MSNLERPIIATAAACQPGLLDRWDLQGGRRCQPANTKQIFSTTNPVHSISFESFENQISTPVTRNICFVFAFLGICMLQAGTVFPPVNPNGQEGLADKPPP